MSLILAGRVIKSIDDADKVDAIMSEIRRDELFFSPGSHPNVGRRDFAPQGIVLHWTGGESPPVRTPGVHWAMIDQLLKARVSVDFAVDSALTPERRRIVQLADPVGTRTSHAGIANFRFLGIEGISRGAPTKADLEWTDDMRERDELDWEVPRDAYSDLIDGKLKRAVSFHPDALHDMIWLVETLCGLLNIPRRIPWQQVSDGDLLRLEKQKSRLLVEATPVRWNGAWWLPLFDRDTARWGRVAEFSGVMGHFHVHGLKNDPGTQPFYALWNSGYNPTGQKFYRS